MARNQNFEKSIPKMKKEGTNSENDDYGVVDLCITNDAGYTQAVPCY